MTGIDLVKCTSVFGPDGRFSPQFDDSTTLHLDADAVILAIGQQPEFRFITGDETIELTPAGTIKIDPQTLETTSPGVFAGGDAAFGPRIAIEAIANGKGAAQSIHEYLSGESTKIHLQVKVEKIPNSEYSTYSGYEKRQRRTAETVETGKRTGITEVENVYDEHTAQEQAERCLLCHIDTIYDPLKCVLCGRCADVCPQKCLHFTPIEQVDLPEDQLKAALETYEYDADKPLTVLLKDDTECIRCGLCALRCPTEAMTMERFSFSEIEGEPGEKNE